MALWHARFHVLADDLFCVSALCVCVCVLVGCYCSNSAAVFGRGMESCNGGMHVLTKSRNASTYMT